MIDCSIEKGAGVLKEDFYMMWLSRVEGLGRRRIELLLDYFKSPREVWLAPKDTLCLVQGLGGEYAEKICAAKDSQLLERQINELEKKEIEYISNLNPNYPYLLNQIYDPPFGLYIKGTLPDDEFDKVSIVGARRCSQYGQDCAFKIARDIAKRNIVVVSGMARGIDSFSHKGALAAGGLTIAVLGCGADICFPAENKALMNQIVENGCIISEYPPQTPSKPWHFPQRNRIIAGLSKITVVIEAGEKSGSLITVEQALSEGREVFAVPGQITNPLSEGTNHLVKSGAAILTNANDIFEELGVNYIQNRPKQNIKAPEPQLSSEANKIYSCINFEPISLTEIMKLVKEPIQNIQYQLTMLEIKGYIKKLPVDRYQRTK